MLIFHRCNQLRKSTPRAGTFQRPTTFESCQGNSWWLSISCWAIFFPAFITRLARPTNEGKNRRTLIDVQMEERCWALSPVPDWRTYYYPVFLYLYDKYVMLHMPPNLCYGIVKFWDNNNTFIPIWCSLNLRTKGLNLHKSISVLSLYCDDYKPGAFSCSL